MADEPSLETSTHGLCLFVPGALWAGMVRTQTHYRRAYGERRPRVSLQAMLTLYETTLPLDIARAMVVVWFNVGTGGCRCFQDIEKECIAEPCFRGLMGSDSGMDVGVFLRQKTAVFVALLFVVLFALTVTQSFGAESPSYSILPGFREDESRVGQAKIQVDIAQLPLSFISNVGQADANVRFMVKTGAQTIFFTPEEVVSTASGKAEDEVTRNLVVSRGEEFLVGDTNNA